MSQIVVRRRRPGPQQLVAAAVIALVLLGGCFLAVLDAVSEREGIANWDQPVLSFALSHRNGPLTVVFRTVTGLGAGVGLFVVALLVTAYAMWRLRSAWPGLLVVATVAGTELVSLTSKALIQRSRPPMQDWLTQATGYAYPSGHTLHSVCTYGVLAFIGCCLTRTLWARTAVIVAATVMILTIALSRIYLGVHWLTDVLGGVFAGLALLTVAIVVVGIAHPKTSPSRRSIPKRG
jgi:undecaprenyl-diphosphatase